MIDLPTDPMTIGVLDVIGVPSGPATPNAARWTTAPSSTTATARPGIPEVSMADRTYASIASRPGGRIRRRDLRGPRPPASSSATATTAAQARARAGRGSTRDSRHGGTAKGGPSGPSDRDRLTTRRARADPPLLTGGSATFSRAGQRPTGRESKSRRVTRRPLAR